MSLQLLLWDVSGFPAYASGTTHGNWRPQRSPPHLAPLVPFYATKKLLPTEHLLDQSSARCMALHVNVLMCLYVSLKHGCKYTNACSVTMWGIRLYYDVPIKLYVLSIKMNAETNTMDADQIILTATGKFIAGCKSSLRHEVIMHLFMIKQEHHSQLDHA